MSTTRRRGPRRRTVSGITLNRFLICSDDDTIRRKLGASMADFDDSPALVRVVVTLQKERGEHGKPVTSELIDAARQALAEGTVYGG